MRPAVRIALIGIGAALVCLPVAGWLRHWNRPQEQAGLSLMGPNWWSWSGDWSGFGIGGADRSPVTTRQFSWPGDDTLELDLPANVHFRPAAAWTLSIRGHATTLEHLRIEHARVRLDPSFHRHNELDPVEIELTGPALHQVLLRGAGRLVLDGIQQDALRIDIRGSADASASGSVGTLTLNIRGSGNAQLASLRAQTADLSIGGSGNADINCSDLAQINISGSGNVRLHSHPRQLRSRVHGSGEVIELSDGQAI